MQASSSGATQNKASNQTTQQLKAPQSICLLAVACVAFGVGVVSDRIWFTSGGAAGDGSGRQVDEFLPQPAELADASLTDPSNASDGRGKSAITDADDRGSPTTLDQLNDHLERGVAIDFAACVAMLDQLPAGEQRREFIHRIASHWGREDPGAALAWADELNGEERFLAIENILHEWAQLDPASASDYVAHLPNSERSLDWMHGVAQAWAEQDQAAAIAWGLEQRDPTVRRRALRGATGVWAGTDAAAAGAFAVSLDNPYERHALLEEVAHRWAEQSTEDALNWAGSLEGGDRVRATSEILHQLAGEDPRLAAQIYDGLAPSLPDQAEREGARQQIAPELASRWSRTAPREAADWAMTLPESGEVQRAAVSEVAENWLRSDSLAASEWITQLPDGKTRDAAAGRVVEQVARSDHESAFAWATSVSDEGYQTELMHHVLEGWKASDPDAARAALIGADLSTKQREHFDGMFGKSPPPMTAPDGDERADLE